MGSDEVRVTGTAHVALSDHHEGDRAEVRVTVAYRFVEDGRIGSHCPLTVEPPPGFARMDDAPDVFEGVLECGTDAAFGFATEPYEAAWTGRLYLTADIGSEERNGDEA